MRRSIVHPAVRRPMVPSCHDFDASREQTTNAAVPMLSTLYVDDDDDGLRALCLAATATAERRDGAPREHALGQMPTALATWATSSRWPRPSVPKRPPTARAEAWMFGTVCSAALAGLLAVGALLWRMEHPTATPREHAPAAVIMPHGGDATPDAISGASRR